MTENQEMKTNTSMLFSEEVEKGAEVVSIGLTRAFFFWLQERLQATDILFSPRVKSVFPTEQGPSPAVCASQRTPAKTGGRGQGCASA